MANVRVPGFLPSTNGLHFSNSWPAVPDWKINIAGVIIPIGDASNGMCGGMTYTVRDMFQAGLQPPGDLTAPAGGPLFDYIASRLLDSFNLPFGPAIYLALMNPALPDHETWIEPLGHGRAWRMINEAWPAIRADLDSGMLSPVSLVEVKSLSAFDLGQNHQVLAFGYDLNGSALTLHLYDPNSPNDDTVTMSLDISNPDHTTDVTYSTGSTIWCFFRSSYAFKNPVLATGFGPNEDWTHGPYYGSRGTFFADVTGDGRADAIVVNDDTVTVRRSTGNGFGPNEDWTHGPYYGSRGTFFADVTGDGRADAIVVNDNTVTVRRSTGNGFGPNEDWTHGAFFGSRGTFFVDVDGDGRADAIAVNDITVTVRRSTGNGFGPNEDWTHGAFYGSRGTLFADVTGDGRADAIVINDNTVTVRRSTGNGFGPNEDWTHGAFYGSRGTLFADVTGDGRADAIAINDNTVTARRSI